MNVHCDNTYILLTKREGRTGRISARGLDSTDRAALGPYKKKPRADILLVRSRASLVNKRFITRLKKALKVFENSLSSSFAVIVSGSLVSSIVEQNRFRALISDFVFLTVLLDF